MEKIDSLEQLIDTLNPDFKDVEVYTQAMNSLTLKEESIENYCHWKPDFYTRNLVKRTKAYELMVLCWPPNQTSPIHNHQGQDCWMHVISGEITEIQYHCIKDDESGVWQIKEGNRVSCTPTKTAYINDKICLHQICNNSDEPAITLHLYSYPIETCNIYCCKTGKVTSRKLGYSSIDGEKVDAEKVSQDSILWDVICRSTFFRTTNKIIDLACNGCVMQNNQQDIYL